MSIITEILPPRSFEIVSARICEILADEIARQAYVTGDPFLEEFLVFEERFIPADKEEHYVNVSLNYGEFTNQDAGQQDGTYLFNIDVYTSAKSNALQWGDSRAMVRLRRLLGLCWSILMHSRYMTLGFVPPFIMNRSMQRVLIQQPDTSNTDAAHMVMGRMVLSVRVAEVAGVANATLAAGFDTLVKLEETDKGYQYIVEA